MKNFLRNTVLGAAIFFAIVWVYLICLNYPLNSVVQLPFLGEIEIRTSWMLLGFGLFTCLIDGLSCLWLFQSKTDLNKNYQMKMDKLSVQSDSDKSQIKVLENKIKTLEAVVEKLTKKD